MTAPTSPLDDLLRALGRLLVEHLPPRRPLRVRLTQVSRTADVLIYTLQLPPAGAPDVVTRELTVEVDGQARDVLPAAEGQELAFADNAAVRLTLVDVDDAGNRSEPSPPLDFIAVDSIAPPAPGALGVTLAREE